MRHQLDQVLIAMVILCQNDQVIAAHVSMFLDLILQTMSSHIHFTSKNGLERFFPFLLQLLINAVGIIKKLFHPKHVPMVSQRHASHAITYGFVYEFWDLGHSIQNRIMCMNM